MAWFTPDFNLFFKDLAAHNDRDWFAAQRQRYEQSVKEPFAAFTAEMLRRIGRADKAVRITPKEAIFRIHRDVRFSRDKSPYKLYCAAIISPAGRGDQSMPGMYYELGPEAVRIYGGAYAPDKEQLTAIRHAILADGAALRRIVDGAAFRRTFGTVQGEVNKVLPAPFKAAMAHEPLIAHKQFYVAAELPPAMVTDPALVDVLMAHHRVLRPFHAWLRKAMG
ncbi:MAG: DUF2461 domain-containing protein [Flavobacteriales bacterium]|jgi:uncharacterized protein (TIGR02453 family)|nr:DUF2461 domain-containing protein [Flavobacteriales bacterium]